MSKYKKTNEAPATKLVNLKHDCQMHYVRIDRSSRFGNPFRIGRDGTRDQVIAKYRIHLWNMIQSGELTIWDLCALRGKTLACWCAPKACHGDVLIKAIEWAHRKAQADEEYLMSCGCPESQPGCPICFDGTGTDPDGNPEPRRHDYGDNEDHCIHCGLEVDALALDPCQSDEDIEEMLRCPGPPTDDDPDPNPFLKAFEDMPYTLSEREIADAESGRDRELDYDSEPVPGCDCYRYRDVDTPCDDPSECAKPIEPDPDQAHEFDDGRYCRHCGIYGWSSGIDWSAPCPGRPAPKRKEPCDEVGCPHPYCGCLAGDFEDDAEEFSRPFRESVMPGPDGMPVFASDDDFGMEDREYPGWSDSPSEEPPDSDRPF